MKRQLDIVVISDTHLGTFGAKANKLIQYLSSIEPKTLIINGDLIDIWQFTRLYFPKEHLKALQIIVQFIQNGTTVYYLTGNHDDLLRKFTPIDLQNFHLLDELTLEINNKKYWILHGDKYDKTIKARIPAIMGGFAYHILIVVDGFINRLLKATGANPIRISKKLKDFTKRAAKKIANFEDDALDAAIQEGYDVLICGHIHKPQLRNYKNHQGEILYLNSGDWVENASALEYSDNKWQVFYFDK